MTFTEQGVDASVYAPGTDTAGAVNDASQNLRNQTQNTVSPSTPARTVTA